jgi:hypothetical protein
MIFASVHSKELKRNFYEVPARRTQPRMQTCDGHEDAALASRGVKYQYRLTQIVLALTIAAPK